MTSSFRYALTVQQSPSRRPQEKALRALAAIAFLSILSAVAEAGAQHPWRPPFGLERVGSQETGPDLQAAAVARPDRQINPVDLNTILVPYDWLLLRAGQTAVVDIAVFSRT